MNMRERIARYDAPPTLPCNRIVNLRRRVSRVRDFPTHTCPASRHLHLMADNLLRYGTDRGMQDEPEHCAASMLAVLESLWTLRKSESKRASALTRGFVGDSSQSSPERHGKHETKGVAQGEKE